MWFWQQLDQSFAPIQVPLVPAWLATWPLEPCAPQCRTCHPLWTLMPTTSEAGWEGEPCHVLPLAWCPLLWMPSPTSMPVRLFCRCNHGPRPTWCPHPSPSTSSGHHHPPPCQRGCSAAAVTMGPTPPDAPTCYGLHHHCSSSQAVPAGTMDRVLLTGQGHPTFSHQRLLPVWHMATMAIAACQLVLPLWGEVMHQSSVCVCVWI